MKLLAVMLVIGAALFALSAYGSSLPDGSIFPGDAVPDTGVTAAADVQTLGVRAGLATTTRLPDALAYEITKAVFDNFEDFRRLHPLVASLSIHDMVDGTRGVPIHDGAARYYREHGWVP